MSRAAALLLIASLTAASASAGVGANCSASQSIDPATAAQACRQATQDMQAAIFDAQAAAKAAKTDPSLAALASARKRELVADYWTLVSNQQKLKTGFQAQLNALDQDKEPDAAAALKNAIAHIASARSEAAAAAWGTGFLTKEMLGKPKADPTKPASQRGALSSGLTTAGRAMDAVMNNARGGLREAVNSGMGGVIDGGRTAQEDGLPPSPPEAAQAPSPEVGRLAQQEQSLGTDAAPEQVSAVADAYARAGEPWDAERLYRRAVERKPEAESYARLAQAELQIGDKRAAAEDARKAQALDPRNALANMIIGHGGALSRVKTPAGGFGAPAGAAETAAGPAPGRMPDGRGPAAGGSAAAGAASPSAAAVSGAVLAALPPAAGALLQRALSNASLGDLTTALLLASQVIEAAPKDPRGWALRAELLGRLKSYDASLKDAEQALVLDPVNAQALRAKAYAELELGRLELALADVERSLALQPASAMGRLYRAMIMEKLGRGDEALAEFDRAAALDASLAPLAAEARARLRGSAAPSTARLARGPASDPRLVRYGMILGALALLLAGLTGTKTGREITEGARRALTGRRAAATLVDEGRELEEGALVGGQYRVTRELGRGGMGVVYEALDETLQRRVALKRMQGGTPEDVERFLKEARLVAQLKHPRIAEIHNVVLEREPLLVFELVEGRPLDAVLRERGPLPADAARKVVAQVCEALECAHARGIIHRDLKPSNVIVASDGALKVMDFGIAHQSRGAATATMTAASGTPAYMAPEQALGSVSKASDLYALAVMAYELLAGSRPFAGPDFLEQKLRETYERASARRPGLPPALDGFFARALAADPTKRFGSADQFREAFEGALALASA